MQKHWLIKAGNPDLIVAALGWASDYHAVEGAIPDGYDTLCLYDYRTLEAVTREETGPYRRTLLLGWSFGVWAAEQTCRELPLDGAWALNGTPLPVDDRFGIPGRSVLVTLRGIRKAGIETFNRRTYGASYERMSRYFDDRTPEEKIAELETLFEQATRSYTPMLRWKRAVIGTEDVIFPPANMAAYWQRKALVVPGMPHYPFGQPGLIDDLLNNDPQ